MRRLRDMAAAATVAALLAGWFTTTARGQDLTTALSQFLSNLSAGNLVVVQGTNASMLKLGGTTSAFPALKRNGASIDVRLADDSAPATISTSGVLLSSSFFFGAGLPKLMGAITPTIGSGFGTGPSVVSGVTTATFRVNVGTGGVATSGVIALTAATTGWNCAVSDITNSTATRQTADTTTSVTVTAASAWAASDILLFNCLGF